jgi:hypothetical protein
MERQMGNRTKLTLTQEQETLVERMLQEASQLGIPTSRNLILREVLKKGFEIYSVVHAENSARSKPRKAQ